MPAILPDLTILVARARRARESRERHAAEVCMRVCKVLQESLPHEGRAWLIGSLVWGGFGERSDVDVVVWGLNGPEQVVLERRLIAASGAEVDMIDYEALPATFRTRVTREGVEFRGA